jgi:hypothetical protein
MKTIQCALASLTLAFAVLAGASGAASAASMPEAPVSVGDQEDCGGGCNQYGCWNTPYGSCNQYGCRDVGGCNQYGCWDTPRGGCNQYGCWR